MTSSTNKLTYTKPGAHREGSVDGNHFFPPKRDPRPLFCIIVLRIIQHMPQMLGAGEGRFQEAFLMPSSRFNSYLILLCSAVTKVVVLSHNSVEAREKQGTSAQLCADSNTLHRAHRTEGGRCLQYSPRRRLTSPSFWSLMGKTQGFPYDPPPREYCPGLGNVVQWMHLTLKVQHHRGLHGLPQNSYFEVLSPFPQTVTVNTGP